MPTKPPLGFVGGRAVHEGPGGGCPFPQHVYDAVALERRMSVERMQVDVPTLAGMLRRAVLKLAKKVEAKGREPGRHGVHRSHRRKVHALHVNFLLQRMRETGARVTLDWMRDQLHMYFGVQITQSGLSRALAAHNVCHKKLTQLNKEAFSEFNVELTRRVRLLEPREETRARDEPSPSLTSCIPVSCSNSSSFAGSR
jgi:transposase